MGKHLMGFLVVILAMISCDKKQSVQELRQHITEELSSQQVLQLPLRI